MSMIRSQNLTPSEYSTQSRDFQLMCRLYDTVFNGIQYDISTIPSILNTSLCRDTLLPLLQTKVGFFTNKEINNASLRYFLEVFPIIVHKKGTTDAIRQAVITFLKINNIKSPVVVYYTVDSFDLHNKYVIPDHTLVVGINSSFQDVSLLEEVFRYILPAGIGYYFYFYSDIKELQTFSTSDSAVLIYTSYNVNAQVRGTTSVENTNGTYQDPDANRLINAVHTVMIAGSEDTPLPKMIIKTMLYWEISQTGTTNSSGNLDGSTSIAAYWDDIRRSANLTCEVTINDTSEMIVLQEKLASPPYFRLESDNEGWRIDLRYLTGYQQAPFIFLTNYTPNTSVNINIKCYKEYIVSSYLGHYEGEDSFETFIASSSIVPVEENIILYNNDEYIYKDSNWHKVIFFGSVNNINQRNNYSEPVELYEVIYVADDKYYMWDGEAWVDNTNELYIYLKKDVL